MAEETFPKPGIVNEVCREWVVKEDGALAYRLQSEEFEHHLSGNRWRNAVVREDFPRALDEQRREQLLAEEARRREAQLQEEYDARVAAELAEQMEREEAAKRAALETRDQHVAWRLQEREKRRAAPAPEPPAPLVGPSLDPDPNCVGLPPPPDDLAARVRILRIQGAGCTENTVPNSRRVVHRGSGDVCDVDAIENYGEEEEAAVGDDDELRRIQEERDAELARILQEREAAKADPHRHLSDLDRDRLVALEAQDRELARLLQERERAKARRARERARQRAAEGAPSPRGPGAVGHRSATQPTHAQLSQSPPPLPAVRPTDLDLTATCRPDFGPRAGYQRPSPDLEDDASGFTGSPNSPSPSNIAAAIDPTYRRGSGASPALTEPLDPAAPALPYMPIQGQRRCPPQPDKRSCRKELGVRDACRQQ